MASAKSPPYGMFGLMQRHCPAKQSTIDYRELAA